MILPMRGYRCTAEASSYFGTCILGLSNIKISLYFELFGFFFV